MGAGERLRDACHFSQAMRIVSKFKVAVLVPALIAVVSGTAIGFQNHALQTAQENYIKVRDIISSINFLSNLAYSYMLHQEERPKQQFLDKHQKITQLISEIECRDLDQREALAMVENDVENMRKLFFSMVFHYEHHHADEKEITVREEGEHLGGELLATASQTVENGLALARHVNDLITSIQRELNRFVMTLIVGVTVVLTFILAGTMKTISVSLTKLAKGAEKIGSGDLDHRIGMRESDELGDLARAFDKMTEQLSHSYSELRESEERLRNSEETLRLAIEATSLGTFDFYPRTGELEWSELTKRHFGLPPEAHVDYQVFLAGLHPDDRERVNGIVQGLIQPDDGELYDIEFRTTGLQDGRERWLTVRGRTILNHQGELIRFIGATLDITERKRNQEQLQRMKDELEEKVEERTRELIETQRKYLHAEKLSAIGKLSASIAHEFNNPLQAIMTILKGLSHSGLDENDRKMLEMALSECERVKKLIRDLQNFYRPSSEKKEFVHVHKLLDSLLLLLKSEFRRRGISVELAYAERLPLISAVADQLKQVFLNLLSNAIEACPRSGGVITILTRKEDGSIVIAVKDTGVGIKPEDIDRIFQPFYTTKSAIKGTGLGLSVSYGIVKKHGGKIQVESEPGQGAIFTILLPIKEESEIEDKVW